jgi:Flp pilus assembly protein TadG
MTGLRRFRLALPNRAAVGRRRMTLRRDREGAVAMLFALAALPLLGLVGLAIDFGFATQAKSQLALAADTAAMQATVTAANAFATGTTTLAQAESLGVTAGQNWFAIQAGNVIAGSNYASPTVTIAYNEGTFTTSLSYQVDVGTFFGRLFGVPTIAESGSSQAVVTNSSYVNVTFLLDNSSSMLIASTQSGITTLDALTAQLHTTPWPARAPVAGTPCAFACHWTTTANASDTLTGAYPEDLYGVARNANPPVQLRFDVLVSATATAINSMNAVEQRTMIPNQFGVGVFTFNCVLSEIYPVGTANAACPATAPTISPTTISSTSLLQALPAVNAMVTPVVQDSADTNFSGPDGAMAQLTALLPTAGDGSSPSQARQALFIVTDGMQDWGTRVIPTNEGPMNPVTVTPQDCDAAKAKGITVYVIYTTYDEDSTVLLFGNSALKPYLDGTASPGMVASLQACASSPADFIEATDATSIQAAFTSLLQVALSSPVRFTR